MSFSIVFGAKIIQFFKNFNDFHPIQNCLNRILFTKIAIFHASNTSKTTHLQFFVKAYFLS
ncbi:hypothetical protein B0A64_02665 [Flavobacterium araucananum]|uniref:Uncharacterized protein n=1 Tax=Flavobacterium araucananum TaxID=946678 RepID=A0A227PH86_9FLAO|nr:hypothetical protein B0A64_02665 [Flavobacterium araucananum]